MNQCPFIYLFLQKVKKYLKKNLVNSRNPFHLEGRETLYKLQKSTSYFLCNEKTSIIKLWFVTAGNHVWLVWKQLWPLSVCSEAPPYLCRQSDMYQCPGPPYSKVTMHQNHSLSCVSWLQTSWPSGWITSFSYVIFMWLSLHCYTPTVQKSVATFRFVVKF